MTGVVAIDSVSSGVAAPPTPEFSDAVLVQTPRATGRCVPETPDETGI